MAFVLTLAFVAFQAASAHRTLIAAGLHEAASANTVGLAVLEGQSVSGVLHVTADAPEAKEAASDGKLAPPKEASSVDTVGLAVPEGQSFSEVQQVTAAAPDAKETASEEDPAPPKETPIPDFSGSWVLEENQEIKGTFEQLLEALEATWLTRKFARMCNFGLTFGMSSTIQQKGDSFVIDTVVGPRESKVSFVVSGGEKVVHDPQGYEIRINPTWVDFDGRRALQVVTKLFGHTSKNPKPMPRVIRTLRGGKLLMDTFIDEKKIHVRQIYTRK